MSRPGLAAIAAALVCVISQVIATSPLMGSGWDGFGRAIWLTILVTFPAFVAACVFAMIALVGWLRSRRGSAS